jgi:hypothetical protein
MTIQQAAAPIVPIDLDALDAELVAVDGVPVTDVALVREPNLPATYQPAPELDNPRQSLLEDPYWVLMGLKWGLITAITAVAVYGVVWTVLAITNHATDIGIAAGGGIGLWLILGLFGGGGVVCADLHCAGCRR